MCVYPTGVYLMGTYLMACISRRVSHGACTLGVCISDNSRMREALAKLGTGTTRAAQNAGSDEL
jgi:hypothetical protein